MVGPLVNAIAIVVGGLIGFFSGRRIRPELKEPVMAILGLVTLTIGVRMALTQANTLMVLAGLVMGTVVGETLRIEERITRAGSRFERRASHASTTNALKAPAEGFVATTLLFCVGAMAITGSLESGLKGQNQILLVKAVMDGVASIVFANTHGLGVVLSAISVLLYEGSIAFFAYYLKGILGLVEAELYAAGGILLVGIGLNILGATHLRVANMLPGLVFAPLLSAVRSLLFRVQ